MTTYEYTKTPVDINRLTLEIQQSSITIVLDHITLLGSDVTIAFKVSISNEEKTTLDTIVANHSGEPLPDTYVQKVDVAITRNNVQVDSWENFKSIAAKKGQLALLQYEETSDHYRIFFVEGGILLWEYIMSTGSLDEITDFVTNYKNNCNREVEPSTVKNIKFVDISSSTTKSLWIPAPNKILLLYGIEIFGYCNATANAPFVLKIEIKINNEWKTLCGLKSISTREFTQSYNYANELKSDKGDGTIPVLRVTVKSSDSLDFTISTIGIEF